MGFKIFFIKNLLKFFTKQDFDSRSKFYKIMKKYYGKSKLFNLIKPTRITKTIKIDYKKNSKNILVFGDYLPSSNKRLFKFCEKISKKNPNYRFYLKLNHIL